MQKISVLTKEELDEKLLETRLFDIEDILFDAFDKYKGFYEPNTYKHPELEDKWQKWHSKRTDLAIKTGYKIMKRIHDWLLKNEGYT